MRTVFAAFLVSVALSIGFSDIVLASAKAHKALRHFKHGRGASQSRVAKTKTASRQPASLNPTERQKRVNKHMAVLQNKIDHDRTKTRVLNSKVSKMRNAATYTGRTPSYLEIGSEPTVSPERDPYGYEPNYRKTPDLAIEKEIYDEQRADEEEAIAAATPESRGQFDEKSIGDFFKVRAVPAN